MMIAILKGKIYGARVTATEVDYEGSIEIDRTLMDAAGILTHEKVLVADMENGNRFETYVIEGEGDSGVIGANGAAARLTEKGNRVIIMAFAHVDEEEARTIKPRVVRVDEKNTPLD